MSQNGLGLGTRAERLPVLEAEISDVRPFARLLRGIGFKHHAVMTISEAGFEVALEEVRTLCAIAWIPHTLFRSFIFRPPDEPATFEISLDSLLQCLNIFGNAGNAGGGTMIKGRKWAGDSEVPDDEGGSRRSKDRRTQMRLTWDGYGSMLDVILRDEGKGPTTRCSLKTIEPEELMNQEFNEQESVLYLIMKAGLLNGSLGDLMYQSEWFRDALLDLPPSSQRITFTALPAGHEVQETVPAGTANSERRRTKRLQVGNFQIAAEGDFGRTELDYPNDREVMDRFECANEVTFSYHSSHIMLLSRALQQSIKICLQIEESGFLCVQIMMPVQDPSKVGQHSGILEFKMHCLEEDHQ